jgi:2-acylglycerol O-acyltransferase 2
LKVKLIFFFFDHVIDFISKKKLGDMKWAPLNVPWTRRKQTGAIFLFLILFWLCLGATLASFFWWPLTWPFLLGYASYCIYDKSTPLLGGRSSAIVRRVRSLVRPWFRVIADYFPAKLHVESDDFDASKKYMFALFPHGWIGLSVWMSFMSDANDIGARLNGVDFRIVTLPANFSMPFWRDLLLAFGLVSSSRAAIEAGFARNLSMAIVVGGAREAMFARPNKTITLVLARRKGFVRLAIEQGAALVPVFSFGETDLYDQLEWEPGTWQRRAQDWLLERLGVSFPIVRGRGIFNYSLGFLPFRRELNTVVGKPIEVERIEQPSEEQVDAVHKQYCDALRALFERRKDEFGYNDHHLELV